MFALPLDISQWMEDIPVEMDSFHDNIQTHLFRENMWISLSLFPHVARFSQLRTIMLILHADHSK